MSMFAFIYRGTSIFHLSGFLFTYVGIITFTLCNLEWSITSSFYFHERSSWPKMNKQVVMTMVKQI